MRRRAEAMDPGFVIGGAPKCATTALFDYLAQHPEIFGTIPKEPHFFASAATGRPVMQGDLTEAEYLRLFARARDGQITGEGSTHYLHHSRAVAPLMAKLAPGARLVFCLRNPVDRAYSHFLFRYSVAGPFTLGGVGQLREFRTFVSDPEMFAMGDYAANLDIFGNHFPHEQIHLIFFEDIVRDPAGCLRRLCCFLGVDPAFNFDLSQRSNETVYPRSPRAVRLVDPYISAIYPALSDGAKRRLMRIRKAVFFSSNAAKQKLEAEDRAFALELYRPSIERLEEITGRDLANWRQD